MDSCNDDVLNLILFEYLSSSPRGGLSTLMVQCRLVCKRWNKAIFLWPEYKEMKTRANAIGSFVDGLVLYKLSHIVAMQQFFTFLTEGSDQRFPELVYGLLQHVKYVCIHRPSQDELELISMCESMRELRITIGADNLSALSVLRHCKKLQKFQVLDRNEIHYKLKGLEDKK